MSASHDTTHLYILCGLPFVGTSTFTEALHQRFGFPAIAIDAIISERGLGLNAAPTAVPQ